MPLRCDRCPCQLVHVALRERCRVAQPRDYSVGLPANCRPTCVSATRESRCVRDRYFKVLPILIVQGRPPLPPNPRPPFPPPPPPRPPRPIRRLSFPPCPTPSLHPLALCSICTVTGTYGALRPIREALSQAKSNNKNCRRAATNTSTRHFSFSCFSLFHYLFVVVVGHFCRLFSFCLFVFVCAFMVCYMFNCFILFSN